MNWSAKIVVLATQDVVVVVTALRTQTRKPKKIWPIAKWEWDDTKCHGCGYKWDFFFQIDADKRSDATKTNLCLLCSPSQNVLGLFLSRLSFSGIPFIDCRQRINRFWMSNNSEQTIESDTGAIEKCQRNGEQKRKKRIRTFSIVVCLNSYLTFIYCWFGTWCLCCGRSQR